MCVCVCVCVRETHGCVCVCEREMHGCVCVCARPMDVCVYVSVFLCFCVRLCFCVCVRPVCVCVTHGGEEVPSFVMKPRFPALQPACNLGPLPTPTSAAASPPSRPPQETPRAPLGTRAGAAVSPRSLGRGWQRLRREAVEPWIPTKQGSWQRPPRRGPPEYRPWALGEVAVLGAGTEGQGRGRAPRDGAHPDSPCQQGEAGHFRPLQGGAHTSASAQGALGPGGT